MSEVGVRELNQNTAGVLARVKQGEEIDITERGAVVARLVPARPGVLSELISTGKLRPATKTGPSPRPAGPTMTAASALNPALAGARGKGPEGDRG
ncbi:type II toxin-antitoxin system prevent-host-death family antitoxin [Amycolatopsis minnesotensis]|uniref:Type II toxin-antitoxin system prevent-host-death family antitoxin n=1 Tax=Amycolatopsis minnesotensis TaxID=337894 RepID=A0ABN2RI06_9PSEU